LVPDFGVLIAPGKTYRQLAADEATTGWAGVLQRCAVGMLVLGTVISLVSTGTATLWTVASAASYWLIVPLIQLALALLLVITAPERRVSTARCVELMWVGHLPWTLWLLTVAILLVLNAGVTLVMAAAALIAAAWRGVIVCALCREVLGASPRNALIRAALHQAAALGIIFLYAGWAVALEARF
jgi:hypothetical protein